MVGRLSEARRHEVAVMLLGLVSGDAETVAEVMQEWRSGDEGDSDTSPERLRRDIEAFVDQYKGVPLKRLDLTAMLSDLMALLREHGLALPPDLALLIKALLTLEGLGRQLDPDFDMTGAAQPWLQRLMWQRHSPRALAQRGQQSLSGALDLLTDLPRDLRRLVQSARRGRLRGQIEVTSLKAFGDQVNSAANRMTMGVIVAALIIGSSIVMNAVSNGPGNPWLMALGVIGFIGAALGGVWILLSIWRSGRRR